MTNERHPLAFLQSWYLSQCNGEWEHVKGVTIESLETPGWMVTIDLAGTSLEDAHLAPVSIDRSPSDWIAYRVEAQRFIATGDSSKLIAILQTFGKWAAAAVRVK